MRNLERVLAAALEMRNNGKSKATLKRIAFYPVLGYSLQLSVIPLQHRSCSVCMSFVRLGHHNG